MPQIERPLDFLNHNKGKRILVYLKENKTIAGDLLAFDIHINLVIDNAREITNGEKNIGIIFIRGDTVNYIASANSKGGK